MSFQSETPLGTEIKNGTSDTPQDTDNLVFERDGVASPFKITYLALKNLLATLDTAVVKCGFFATNFADSTTYYFGTFLILAATSATNTRGRFTAPLTGKIQDIYCRSLAATPTSNENIPLSVHNLTQGTSLTLGNLQFNANQYNSFTNLNFAVTEGDVLEFRLTVPVLATNGAASQVIIDVTFNKL